MNAADRNKLFMMAMLLTATLTAGAFAQDRVKVATGTLEGTADKSTGVRSFKGVPFAADEPAPARAIVLMGNEQSGLAPDMEAACDLLVKLPMRGRADSLNLAVATAVMLYDLWRRRGYDGARA